MSARQDKVSILLEPILYAAYLKAAEKSNMSLSAFGRKMVIDYLRQREMITDETLLRLVS